MKNWLFGNHPGAFLLPAALVFAALVSCGGSGPSGIAKGVREKPLPERAAEIIHERAERYAGQELLVVDYYRIYRKLAYPLPVTEIHRPDFFVAGISKYPWEIWMTWELEERINSLGWAAQSSGDESLRSLVRRDLEALAGWPEYDVWESPHLSGAHCARILASAYKNWPWLGEELKRKIETALGRIVNSFPEWLNDGRLDLTTAQAVLDSPQRASFEHNIPTIAMIGRALAARIAGHSQAQAIETHTGALVQAQLDMRSQGHTEAISYDGYILDFAADWLPGAQEDVRSRALEHPALSLMLDQSWLMSAPGNVLNVAPFNDVEPREMPFHAGAHAKLLALREDPRSRWFLANCPLEWLRSDALAALAGLPDSSQAQAPASGAFEGLYTMVLRTGWDSTDVAVAISATDASVGHIQNDKGTLVIGSGGNWLVDDPGYQQYVPGLEREFTLGPTAHNYPVINGVLQKANRVKRLDCSGRDGVLHAAVDITEGYEPGRLDLQRVVRHVWLRQAGDKTVIVVADRIQGRGIETVDYNWHTHPQAALWLAEGACLVHLGHSNLWIDSPNLRLEGRKIVRLPGTRGQVTVQAQAAGADDCCIWWVFTLGAAPAGKSLSADGLVLEAAGMKFSPE